MGRDPYAEELLESSDELLDEIDEVLDDVGETTVERVMRRARAELEELVSEGCFAGLCGCM